MDSKHEGMAWSTGRPRNGTYNYFTSNNKECHPVNILLGIIVNVERIMMDFCGIVQGRFLHVMYRYVRESIVHVHVQYFGTYM